MSGNSGRAGRGIREEFEDSGLSLEGFAAQLGVDASWLLYWLELASVRSSLGESPA